MGAPGTESGNGTTVENSVAIESAEAAEEAGLSYVSDDRPGYTRKARNGEFEYLDTQGKRIRDEQRLLRIKRLAIPPAWTNVWICPSPTGHIQATGRDARRRKQYRYHERWRELRDENKFDRLAAFAKALPKIRRRIAKDLKLRGLPREKVLATVVRLLERTFIRIGNEEYARENKSFGLTTIKNRHVSVRGPHLRFRFRGKSGRQHEVDMTDRRIAKIVSKCQDLPGQDLFQYVSDDGEPRNVTSQDVNDYLREITNENFSARFPDLGGNGPGRDSTHRPKRVRNKETSEGEFEDGNLRGGTTSRQYSGSLPQMLRASGNPRSVCNEDTNCRAQPSNQNP